jgi:exonuclease III
MTFGTWNVNPVSRTGSLKTVMRELGMYKVDLVGVKEVRWQKGGTEWADDYTYFYGERNRDQQLGIGFFIHKSIESAVRRVEFISDRMLYIILRGHCCNFIVLDVHVTCKDKSDDVQDRFYKEQGHVFHQFPRNDMKIFWGDFNA